MPLQSNLEDLTLEDLQNLENCKAWQVFIQELTDHKVGLQIVLSSPSQTETIDDVRMAQGRIQIIEENLAWIDVIREGILTELEEQKEKVSHED
uniref:Uncharacterized protein n=1 Tax=viral metagenome TaxID=1070528 RepID=A0A6M3KVJ2_9ZZZZ